MTTKKLSRILTVAAVAFAFAVLLAVSSMAGITANFDGTISGLEENGNYQYTTFTINSDGTGLTESDPVDLTPESKVVGLVKIYQKSEGSEPTALSDILYVRGSTADRVELCNVNGDTGDVDTTNKIYAQAGSKFVPGYWVGKNADTHKTFTKYCVSTLGLGWISSDNLKAVNTAEAELTTAKATLEELETAETPDETAIAEAKANVTAAEENVLAKRNVLVSKSTNNWLYYGYDPDEIIAIDELNTFKFTTASRQGASYTGTYESKAVVYITDLAGTVGAYEYVTPALENDETRTLDFTDAAAWTPDLPDSGYVVGLKIDQWHGMTDPYAWDTKSTSATMPAFTFLPDGYSIKQPAPQLAFDGTTVTGFENGASYVYASRNVNGIGTEVAIEGNELELTAGLWVIRMKSDSEGCADSDWQVFYVKGNSTDNILHTQDVMAKRKTTYYTAAGGTKYIIYLIGGEQYYKKDGKYYLVSAGDSATAYVGDTTGVEQYRPYDIPISVPVIEDAGDWTTRGTTLFKEGIWTGMRLTNGVAVNNYETDLPLQLSTTSPPIKTNGKTELSDGTYTSLEFVENIMSKIYYAYAYTPNEILPMRDFVSYTYTPFVRQGFVTKSAGELKTAFTLWVVDENNQLVARTAYKNAAYATAKKGDKVTFTLSDFAETDGYIVAIEIRPYADGTEDLEIAADGKNAMDLGVNLIANGYVVNDSILEAPTLSVSDNGVITVSDYNENYSYVYSEDGENWIALTGSSFTATKASHEYMVKIVASDNSEASEVATITSPTIVVAGSSLILDGQIGTKVYLNIDKDVVDGDTLKLNTTRVNADYSYIADYKDPYKIGGIATRNSTTKDWLSPIGYDQDKDLYYVIFYAPAKDADNLHLETDLRYHLIEESGEKKYGSIGIDFKVTDYIAEAKALAAAGVQEFVDAEAVVNALETYLAYADNYFAEDGALAEYDSKLLDDAGIAESVAEGTPTEEGLTYYGTSLILEENVTIRHYFEKADGSFVYYDITDIAAQDIGTAQTFDKVEGFTLTYSVTNYIASMQDNSNAKLVSLVNAMYDYYVAADAYNK